VNDIGLLLKAEKVEDKRVPGFFFGVFGSSSILVNFQNIFLDECTKKIVRFTKFAEEPILPD
jgi:hypothetical protein